ncbi:FkbM family methyltransferase [Methylobacillus caricis]|uniref:FkbM family methyltransferase n=1 Tax=Methylobacillus caricis TaxID=1971611 RepID=UPI001CFF72AC|nr:FkbM family methyltransferase [Methylobacillus caricis]MCB5188968.1 FkbM family methyltransferase [Methylobacillus caricis]
MSQIAYPRLLVVDPTPFGLMCATSQLRQVFIEGWPQDHVLQVWYEDEVAQPLHTMTPGQSFKESASRACSPEAVQEACIRFKPDVIYFRPVESGTLLGFVERLLEKLPVSLIVHMMDDWPERLRIQNPARFPWFDAGLRRILAKSQRRLSIGTTMSRAYASRYGGYWLPLANGVALSDFTQYQPKTYTLPTAASPFIIRYMGSLAEDMTYDSVRDVAEAVTSLQGECAVRLEIYTGEKWFEQALDAMGSWAGVSVLPQVDADAYHRTLSEADALLIAYNFDATSIRYTGLSIANKMPECLASGTPVLAYGPAGSATMAYLRDAGCAALVTDRAPGKLRDAIQALVMAPEERQALAAKAQAHAADHLSRQVVQENFRQYVSPRQFAAGHLLVGPFERKQSAHYDETQSIAHLLAGAYRPGSTMIDVGAHVGSAFRPFLNKGWHIYAFEPDDTNRSKLLEWLSCHVSRHLVTLDTRCVSNTTQHDLSFYRSEQSSGISGLSAFHESHTEAQRVSSVTLSDFFAGGAIPDIDFLKIDTEGHDLFVLQGFPWDQTRPDVIECEFENAKTVSLGYDFHDLAQFLVDKGYTVYVSEWHPILQYGTRHDWHCLAKYPYALQDEASWGNLLAFRDPVDELALAAAVSNLVRLSPRESSSLGFVSQLLNLDGLPLEVLDDKFDVTWYQQRKIFEEKASLLYRFIADEGFTQFVDVGANVGFISILARLAALRLNVVALEPDPRLVELMHRNIARLGLKNIEVINAIVGAESRPDTSFSLNPHSSLDNRVNVSGWHKTLLPMVRLDQVLHDRGITGKTFFKIDVQGFEHMVLRGCEPWLRAHQDWVIKMEFAPGLLRSQGADPLALLAWLQDDCGFAVTELSERIPYGTTELESLFAYPLQKEQRTAFVSYVTSLNRGELGGQVDVLIRPGRKH